MATQYPYTSDYAFYATINHCRDKLAELACIDWNLEYLDQTDLPAMPDGTYGWKQVTIGWTKPFTLNVRYITQMGKDTGVYTGRDADDIDSVLATQKTAADGWATDALSSYPHACAELTEPDAAVFTATAKSLRDEVATPVDKVVDDDIFALTDCLQDWRGLARDSFQTDFIDPFAECAANQAWLAGQVASQLAAAGALIRSGQHTIANIAGAVDAALDEQLALRADQNKGPSTKETLAFLAEVSGLFGLIPGIGDGVKEAIGAVGTIAEFAEGQLPEDAPPMKVVSETAVALAGDLAQIYDAVMAVQKGWQALRDLKTEPLELQLADIKAVHRLVVERSLLADGAGPPQPGDFHHKSSKQYPG